MFLRTFLPLLMLLAAPALSAQVVEGDIAPRERTTGTTQDPNDPLSTAEEQPSFPGGHEAMLSYLDGHTNYPAEARGKGIQGKVFVSFVVECDGGISGVTASRALGGGV
jgi:outer membrane biosynthesis protein TonB